MSRRGTVVTYSRRHQLRQVHADNDNWGNVFGKDDKEVLFSSSFSSGHDSSIKLSDSSIDSSTTRAKKTERSSPTYKEGKENVAEIPENTQRTRRKTPRLYAISDGQSNTSSELDASTHKTRALRDRNTNLETAAKPPKGKKVTNRRKTRKKPSKAAPKSDQQNDSRKEEAEGLFDMSIEKERRTVDIQRQFSEFEEFSLCIEEEKIEEKEIVVNAPPNLTPSTNSTCSGTGSMRSVSHSTPNIHTSTPQMGREPREDLFRRLTKSNVKKMLENGGMSPFGHQSTQFLSPGGNCSALGVMTGISPACSHISRRGSLESDLGDRPENVSRNSAVNVSASSSYMVTTRRRRGQNKSNRLGFSVSSIYSPGFASPAIHRITVPEHISEHSEVAEVSLPVTVDEESMEDDEQALATESFPHPVSECTEQLRDLHISGTNAKSSFHQNNENVKEKSIGENSDELYESAQAYNDDKSIKHERISSVTQQSNSDELKSDQDPDLTHSYDFQEESDKNSQDSVSDQAMSIDSSHDKLQPCEVVMNRLTDSMVSELLSSEQTHKTVSEYDASRSLFDDMDIHHNGHQANSNKSTDYDTAEDGSPIRVPARNLCRNQVYASSTEDTSGSEIDPEDYQSDENLNLAENRRSNLSCIHELDESFRSLKCLTPMKSRSSGRVLSPRTKVLLQCDQDEPMSFNECIPPAMMKKCVKIGEGVYGEVYRSENRKASVALKIIPIEGDFPVNDEPQKTFAEILPEIVISKTLSDLNEEGSHSTLNFVQVKSCAVVQDTYPAALIKQWDRYHTAKVSENDRPDNFPDTQFFIVFEFEDSGCDLEGFKFQSLREAKSVLVQVALSLAVAEAALEFEHRDLHWGNVLVKRTKETTLPFTLDGDDIEISTHGVRVAVIDFTLSRLRKDGCTVFTDMSKDPTMFQGEGDYQFDIYRFTKEENGNNWEAYHPYSNVLWLHYLADKLLRAMTYTKTTTKEHQGLCRQFRTLLREATEYRSAVHLVTQCSFFKDEFLK